jgi:hypothetical protein
MADLQWKVGLQEEFVHVHANELAVNDRAYKKSLKPKNMFGWTWLGVLGLHIPAIPSLLLLLSALLLDEEALVVALVHNAEDEVGLPSGVEAAAGLHNGLELRVEQLKRTNFARFNPPKALTFGTIPSLMPSRMMKMVLGGFLRFIFTMSSIHFILAIRNSGSSWSWRVGW